MINSSANTNTTQPVDKLKVLKWIISILIPLAIQLIPERNRRYSSTCFLYIISCL